MKEHNISSLESEVFDIPSNSSNLNTVMYDNNSESEVFFGPENVVSTEEDNVFDLEAGEECEGHTPPCPKNCIDVNGKCATVTNWMKSKNLPLDIPYRKNMDVYGYPSNDYYNVYEDTRNEELDEPMRPHKNFVDTFIPTTPAVLGYYGR